MVRVSVGSWVASCVNVQDPVGSCIGFLPGYFCDVKINYCLVLSNLKIKRDLPVR